MGRDRDLTEKEREDIARNFAAGMLFARQRKWRTGYRKAIIADLAERHEVTERMVVRCIDQHRASAKALQKANTAFWRERRISRKLAKVRKKSIPKS